MTLIEKRPSQITVDSETWYLLHQKSDEFDVSRGRVYGIAMEIANEDELDARLSEQ